MKNRLNSWNFPTLKAYYLHEMSAVINIARLFSLHLIRPYLLATYSSRDRFRELTVEENLFVQFIAQLKKRIIHIHQIFHLNSSINLLFELYQHDYKRKVNKVCEFEMLTSKKSDMFILSLSLQSTA